jgi:hypothetical protein
MDDNSREAGALDEFLAGERLEDVAIFLADDYLDSEGKLAEIGTAVEGGVVLVVPGDTGRSAFSSGTGMDAMDFAQTAMNVDGEIAPNLDGGTCPESDGGDHTVEFIFAFAEAENEGVGGMYADGDVMHAYAHCTCGTSYSHKWVLGSRET